LANEEEEYGGVGGFSALIMEEDSSSSLANEKEEYGGVGGFSALIIEKDSTLIMEEDSSSGLANKKEEESGGFSKFLESMFCLLVRNKCLQKRKIKASTVFKRLSKKIENRLV
jgi:hypothetical protein